MVVFICFLLLLRSVVSDPTNQNAHNELFTNNIANGIKHRFQRSIINNSAELELPVLWTSKTVPYEFSYTMSDMHRSKIQAAMEEIENKTCLRFRTRQYLNDHSYVKFVKSLDSCSSHIGRRGNEQIIHLTEYCINRHEHILHELMHTLGFFHEHVRHDRDQYISINWQDLDETDRKDINWAKRKESETRYYNTSYDYTSVMHYDTVIGNKSIIKPKQPKVSIKPKGLSEGDVYKINKLYNCSIGNASSLSTSNDATDDIVHSDRLCRHGAYYCGSELRAIDYTNIIADSFLYYCDKGKALYHTNCHHGCLVDRISRCACHPEALYCGHKLFLMNWGKDFEANGKMIYRCDKKMETRMYTCTSACIYSDILNTSYCSLKMYPSTCVIGRFYCGYELAKLGFRDANPRYVYKCNYETEFFGAFIERCENGCVENEIGDSYCSTTPRVAYPMQSSVTVSTSEYSSSEGASPTLKYSMFYNTTNTESIQFSTVSYLPKKTSPISSELPTSSEQSSQSSTMSET